MSLRVDTEREGPGKKEGSEQESCTSKGRDEMRIIRGYEPKRKSEELK